VTNTQSSHIPSDIIYGGYKSETSVLRLSLIILLQHTHIHMQLFYQTELVEIYPVIPTAPIG